MAIRLSVDGVTKVKRVTSDNTTVVKKVVLGTPVRRVSLATGYLSLLNDVDVTDLENGSLLIYNTGSSKWEANTLLEEQEINGGSF